MPIDIHNQTADSISKLRELLSLTNMADQWNAATLVGYYKTRNTEMITQLKGATCINWAQTYCHAKANLDKEVVAAAHQSEIDSKIAAQELEALNNCDCKSRESLIQSIRTNDEKLGTAAVEASRLFKQIAKNNNAVSHDRDWHSDLAKDMANLDLKPLVLEQRCIDQLWDAESNASIRAQLQNAKINLVLIMAAPFIEEVRTAVQESNENPQRQQEPMFKRALEQADTVPAQVWQLQPLAEFRNQVKQKYEQLHLHNNLVQSFDENLPTLDVIDHNGAVNMAELNNSADPRAQNLIKFLKDNYVSLTSSHWLPLSKDGITHDDIKSYADAHF